MSVDGLGREKLLTSNEEARIGIVPDCLGSPLADLVLRCGGCRGDSWVGEIQAEFDMSWNGDLKAVSISL
jgi:hypothetical protein